MGQPWLFYNKQTAIRQNRLYDNLPYSRLNFILCPLPESHDFSGLFLVRDLNLLALLPVQVLRLVGSPGASGDGRLIIAPTGVPPGAAETEGDVRGQIFLAFAPAGHGGVQPARQGRLS